MLFSVTRISAMNKTFELNEFTINKELNYFKEDTLVGLLNQILSVLISKSEVSIEQIYLASMLSKSINNNEVMKSYMRDS
jgi:hypothetical protein